MSLCGPLWVSLLWNYLYFLDLDIFFLPHIRKVFSRCIFRYIFLPFSLSSPVISIMQILEHLMLSQRSLILFSFSKFFFILLFWLGDLYYSVFQVIHFSVLINMLWISSNSVFISVIVLFTFHSLLRFLTCLKCFLSPSIQLSSGLSIIMTSFLNSLSGKWLISVSFEFFSGFFLFLHLGHILLCLHFLWLSVFELDDIAGPPNLKIVCVVL